jgi:hypothetical protein
LTLEIIICEVLSFDYHFKKLKKLKISMTFAVQIYSYPKIDYSPKFYLFIYFCPPQNKAIVNCSNAQNSTRLALHLGPLSRI